MTKFGSVIASSLGSGDARRLTLPHCQFLSALRKSLRWNAFERAPFLEQRLAAARIAFVCEPQRRDAVGAEVPVAVAKLAPCGDDADAIEERECERPHRAPRAL